MAYGTVKIDTIIFDQGGTDQNVTASGIYRAITSGVTVTGTISGAVLIGTTTVSGATVTGTAVQGTTVQGVSGTFTSLTGTTTTGTTANFVSGVFTTRISGTTVTGDTGQFTSGTFVSLTGTTITGTTINAVTVSSTTGTFTSLTGTTITGTTINGVTVAATTGSFTSLTGTTTSGTTANFVSGVFTTQVSGTTVTGTTSNFTSGNFATLSGATATFTSGVIALGTATNPSLSFVGDPNTGIYSPGANELAVATNGTGRLFVDASGNVGVGATSPTTTLDVNGDVKLASINGGPLAGTRNRIINGDMRIDQRSAGASGTANGVYTVDRWNFGSAVASKLTWGQNYNSLTPPAGFTTYMGYKTTTAYTVGASEFFLHTQEIEGYNVSDLAFGTASAKSFTISFWVNSSLTGTFGVTFLNSAQNRCYPATYTISSANTWEYKTITIAGDTSGTWLTTNGKGLTVIFGLGVGSTYSGTAGSWQSSTLSGATGATSVVGTLNATWNITGVQLEPGTVATPFERRSYGQELALCQRYFEKSYGQSQALGTIDENQATWGSVNSVDQTLVVMQQTYKVTKRVAPTVTVYNTATGGTGTFIQGASTATVLFVTTGESIMGRLYATAGMTSGTYVRFHWTASAEL
jgi:hypothetical protein